MNAIVLRNVADGERHGHSIEQKPSPGIMEAEFGTSRRVFVLDRCTDVFGEYDGSLLQLMWTETGKRAYDYDGLSATSHFDAPLRSGRNTITVASMRRLPPYISVGELPVGRSSGPGHFIRFNHFYPAHWSNLSFIRNWSQQQGERTITAYEEQLLHVASTS